MKCKDTIMEYKTYLIVEKGVSKNTLEAYIRDVTCFIGFIDKRFEIDQIENIEKEHIRLYLESLTHLSSLTVSRKIVSLRNYYKFLIKEGILKTNLMTSFELPKTPKKLPQVLSVEEMNRLLNSIKMDNFDSARNRAMIELLYASGIRVSELVNIQLSQINLKMMYLKVIGKGDKERLVPLNQYVCSIIQEYIIHFRNPLLDFKTNHFLFFNKKFKPITRENFYKILNKAALNAGITKKISPHTIRHSYATHLLENNADLRSIQELLGHSDISTTTIYTHITNTKMIDDYNQFHIRARKRCKEEGNEI